MDEHDGYSVSLDLEDDTKTKIDCIFDFLGASSLMMVDEVTVSTSPSTNSWVYNFFLYLRFYNPTFGEGEVHIHTVRVSQDDWQPVAG